MRRSVVLLSTLFMILAVTLVSPLCAADSLSVVSVAEKRVTLAATLGIEQIRSFTLDSPKRLVVDLYGVQPGNHDDEYQLNDGFKLLRVGMSANKTRFVFDVTGSVFPTYKVNTENDQVVVTWEHSQGAIAGALAEPVTVGSAKITSIDFISEGDSSSIYIKLKGNAEATDLVQDGHKIQFSLMNTTLPRSLRRVFDMLAFPSAIHSVTPYLVNESGQSEARFVVTLKGDVPYQLQKDAAGYVFSVIDGRYAQTTAPITGTMPIPASAEAVEVSSSPISLAATVLPEASQLSIPVIEQIGSQNTIYTGEKTSLVFDNAKVRDILRLIAEISDLNIIASDEVKGNVTLRLIDVPWDQALELILDVTGLGMVQAGTVVRVLPKEKIRSLKEAELTAVRSQEKLEPLVTEVVTVSYADLASISSPVKDLLSDRGHITEDSRNKLLIVTDVPGRIEKAKELIEILDTPERQVMIEARIVQVNSNYSRDLGVNWSISAKNDDFFDGGESQFNSLTVGGGYIVDTGNASALANGGVASAMTFGNTLINNVALDLMISALESDGKGKVISTPRVTTLNGETALISQGTTIPYQTSGADGPKTEFVNAELKLEVTPVINPDGSIILEILATNDSPSLTAGASAPSIDTKKAETKVLIRDGETTVIGGIFIENIQESADGIPGIMHIPLLGHLFKTQKKQIVKDELLIFITPHIVHND
ncbi:MAG: type IV pilus secretin PilQ [Thermodesulfobacteriota bacterium]|nr:type IV pilus secretin PilQ [Thermodesulfobacteriota bacterium]